MNKIEIQASLKKVNGKFISELTENEKQQAIESFKRIYAQQMGKVAEQLSKRKKIQENLQQIDQQSQGKIKEIDEEFNKKMSNYEKNQAKQKEIKLKEHKMLQQNWKKRWETILIKKRKNEETLLQKAEKARKETVNYFSNKTDFLKSQLKKPSQLQDQKYQLKAKRSNIVRGQRSASIDIHYLQKHQKLLNQLPTIEKRTSNKTTKSKMNFTSEQILSQQPPKPAQIKFTREKYEKIVQDKEQQLFQKMMNKIQKIQKTREAVYQRKLKQVLEAKKVRKQKQDPEKLARNRQRSLDLISHKKSTIHKDDSLKKIDKSFNRSTLDQSINSHLKAKRLIQAYQFEQREKRFKQKFQKVKKTKIDKIVKQAILALKNETLLQKRE